MPPRDLKAVRRLVQEAWARDAVYSHPHSLEHSVRPEDQRVVLLHGTLGYGAPGPEGERYVAELDHPVLGKVRVVFSVRREKPAEVVVISAHERWNP